MTIHLPIVNGDGELTGDYKPKDFTLATEKAYNATKITDTKMIPEKATTMPMSIVNVYKKRDLKVQKTVVAGTIDNNQEYSFTLKRRDGKAFDVDRSISSIQGVLVLNSKETEKNVQSYSFSLKADQVITFKQIGDMGDEFIVEETGTLPEGMQRLAGGDGITPIILPDITSYVTEEVINGDPNYVIVKKKYSGNGFDESSAQTILSNNLEMKLEFYKISDNTPISVSNIGNYVSLKTLDGIKTVTSGENITMTSNDTIIINLKGIADSASLDKSEIGYNVTETIPTASQKYIPVGEDVFYYIESAGDGDEHNTFSGTSADTVLNVNNTVTKYGSVIYKRVIKEERDGISPEDNAQISFKITDSITGEIPTKPIYYVPAYVSSTGVVTVDPNDIGTVGEGGTFIIEKKAGTGSWSDSGRSDYYLKIYFSEPVLINASSGYTITEDLAHTHSSWGTLIGHEATAEALKRTSGSGEGIITDDWLNSNYQWTYHDMDTFVNTTKTNKVILISQSSRLKNI